MTAGAHILAIVAVLLLAGCEGGRSTSASPLGSATPPSPTLLASIAAKSPASLGRWVSVSGTGAPAFGSSANLAGGGRVLLLDRMSNCPSVAGDTGYKRAAVYDPATDSIAQTAPPERLAHGMATATLADGRVLVAGGFDHTDLITQEAWIWDPATRRWSEAPRMTMGRAWGVMATLRDGRVLALAGETMDVSESPPGFSPTQSAELYDPSLNLWTRTGSVPLEDEPRFAVALTGGLVVVLPENGSSGDIENAAIYDPRRGVWAVVAAPQLFSQVVALVALADGTGLVFDASGSVTRFDPETGWHRAGTLATPRFQTAVAVLPDGRVLIAGGVRSDVDPPGPVKTAELYDPATGRSSSAASLPVPRFNDSATTLADGSVLLVGGVDEPETRLGQTTSETPTPRIDEDNEGDQGEPPCPPPTYPPMRWVP